MKDKRKIYYASIEGRANTIYGFIRGKHLHHEIVVTTSKQKAKEVAWNNLQCDMEELDRECMTRRDFRIDCEDWTDIADLIRDDDYYYTNPILKTTEYRFRPGDKVRICVDKNNSPSVGALEHNGEVVTIKRRCTFTVAYQLEELPNLWSDGCFEKVVG